MTEETVRAVFLKNYSGGDLNKELVVCFEELSLAVFKEIPNKPERPDDIINLIFRAQSRTRLFLGVGGGMTLVVPPDYFDYLDFIRKAMVKVCSYLISVYETTDPWFREKFSVENLRDIGTETKPVAARSNVRNFYPDEIAFYAEMFNVALFALVGKDIFNNFFAKELSKALIVLKKCREEAQMLNRIDSNTTPS